MTLKTLDDVRKLMGHLPVEKISLNEGPTQLELRYGRGQQLQHPLLRMLAQPAQGEKQ
jgi:hypothetical protein